MDEKKLIKIAEGLGVGVIFDQSRPHGVYDDVNGTFSTYQQLFKDLLDTNREVKYQVEWRHHQTNTHNKHGIFDTFEEAMDSIYEWWEVNNFEPRYVQYWTDDGVTEIDYGFHHMFYYIVEGIFKGD